MGTPNPCPAPWFLHGDGDEPLLSKDGAGIFRNTRFTIHGSCNRDQVQGRGCRDPIHADRGGDGVRLLVGVLLGPGALCRNPLPLIVTVELF